MNQQEATAEHVQDESVDTRIVSRQMARELSQEEIDAVSGGYTTCSNCRADDCAAD